MHPYPVSKIVFLHFCLFSDQATSAHIPRRRQTMPAYTSQPAEPPPLVSSATVLISWKRSPPPPAVLDVKWITSMQRGGSGHSGTSSVAQVGMWLWPITFEWKHFMFRWVQFFTIRFSAGITILCCKNSFWIGCFCELANLKWEIFLLLDSLWSFRPTWRRLKALSFTPWHATWAT